MAVAAVLLQVGLANSLVLRTGRTVDVDSASGIRCSPVRSPICVPLWWSSFMTLHSVATHCPELPAVDHRSFAGPDQTI